MTTNPSTQNFLDKLYAVTGQSPIRSQNGWECCCPVHGDTKASMSVSEGAEGRVLVYCHKGCSLEHVCSAIGVPVAELMPHQNGRAMPLPHVAPKTVAKKKPKGRIVAIYDYCDEAGNLVFQVVRYDPKDFRQRRPKAGGGWEWSVKGCRIIPYRLPEILANPGRPVVICEGEKDVDNLAKIGVIATCNAGGAGKWTVEHAEFLRGRSVIVTADHDQKGREHAKIVIRSLYGIAECVRLVELPGLESKEDISDWLARGGTKDQLQKIVNETPDCNPNEYAPWPEWQRFEHVDLPPFPTRVLPQVLRTWVEAESQATQTPLDLAALLSICVCAATIAGKVRVCARPGWIEPTNLYSSIILEPGNRKSAVFADATKPLKEIEVELIKSARPEIAKAQSKRRQDEACLKKLEKQAGEQGKPEAREKARELAARLAEEELPVEPRLIVDDATSEKLGIMLSQQGGALASMSPEGGVFDLMKGLYSKSGIAQFDVYLKGHCGDDLIIDRVSRPSIHVSTPALTCCYAVQPEVIKGLADNSAFRGRGLIARFLFALPESWIGHRQIAPPPVPEAVNAAYAKLNRILFEIKGTHLLELDEDADMRLHMFESDIEKELDDGGDLALIKDWGAKLPGVAVRITGILHCIEFGVQGKISGTTVDRAVVICEYLIPHARAAIKLMELSDDSELVANAKFIFKWIIRHQFEKFSRRDIQQHGKRRFNDDESLDEALKELEGRAIIRSQEPVPKGDRKPGRPKSIEYLVNPAIIEDEFHSQKSQKTGKECFEDIEYQNSTSKIRVQEEL